MNVLELGAQPDGVTDNTTALQKALDQAAARGETVIVPPGIYLTGALFVRSGTTFVLQEGAVLLGAADPNAYPLVSSRTAGIEMDWPAGVVNIRDAEQVVIRGGGIIDGQGEFWWKRYWGNDRKGGLRADYEARDLRWAADYDCQRPGNLTVMNCRDILVEEITLRRSGFWNLHLCYSENLTVRGITVRDNDGPSTDGIDVDSCRDVTIKGCRISCNDDNIALKAGRDADGLRVARPCENVVICENTLLEGEGITLGSETSGGIRNVTIRDCIWRGTKNGLRIKSARTRGGVLENILADGLQMDGVGIAFQFDFDWYTAYSTCKLPDGYDGPVPPHWRMLMEPVPQKQGLPTARGITVQNVRAEHTNAVFFLRGLSERPLDLMTLKNAVIHAQELGSVSHVKNLVMDQTTLKLGKE